jgi:uncharacterized protein YbaR (Trm112 family)
MLASQAMGDGDEPAESRPALQSEAQPEAQARPDRRVLSMLVCPASRTELIYDAARRELISRAARVAYPIRDGVAVMTPDEARPLDDEELRRLAKRCGARG